jgi:hypothetical protein
MPINQKWRLIVQMPYEVQEEFDLVSLLQETAIFLWKEWPRDMQLSRFHQGGGGFTLRGTCPHCGAIAAFNTVSEVCDEQPNTANARMIAAARGICCNQYILAIIRFGYGGVWEYETHYPLGKPNDAVSLDIKEAIRLDYQEALRCRFVNAFNATIEMCRRALETSCIELGAGSDLVLNDMIKWVHSQGKITTPLSEMAHKIKLGGNRAAHPSDRTLTEQDADAVLEFTREYFQHVYVMPARMAQFNFDKPKEIKT